MPLQLHQQGNLLLEDDFFAGLAVPMDISAASRIRLMDPSVCFPHEPVISTLAILMPAGVHVQLIAAEAFLLNFLILSTPRTRRIGMQH
jgi:hypothetical protein